jgi:hypothetical protein
LSELGFGRRALGAGLAEASFGEPSFFVHNDEVARWAGYYVMHALVADLNRWRTRIASLDLASRYAVESPRAPKLEPWGVNVAYRFDPSGVPWHLAERPS